MLKKPMAFRLFPIFVSLAVALVASHAALSPEAYWKTVLPNTAMPKAVRELLHPGKPGGGTRVNVGGKGEVPVHVAMGLPFYYHYVDAAETQVQDDPNLSLFFLEKDMHPGRVMNLYFPEITATATFLPRQVGKEIPFSSEKLTEILKQFSVKPGSVEAEIIKNTIELCEQPGMKGEDKHCATSLESMIDFSTSKLGKNVVAISTEMENQTQMQEYTIEAGAKKMAGEKSVVCHKQNCAHAVFHCHETKARAYMLPLEGADGTKAKAVAVCHTDTSAWNPKHVAFQVLKVKPGTFPICHFLPQDHIVWVAKRNASRIDPNLLIPYIYQIGM